MRMQEASLSELGVCTPSWEKKSLFSQIKPPHLFPCWTVITTSWNVTEFYEISWEGPHSKWHLFKDWLLSLEIAGQLQRREPLSALLSPLVCPPLS